ncbi:MAG TPA: Gfo/Idh/MocA family oxidoreductase [Streptosporangiaceae bacterium]|jgi:predicted dehydrogenase|nr:Gfo/Idh/MocA family oxidoreductase [Streptosporangiaceae bacterium]
MITAKRRYGFGIIGCGVIAPTHAAALAGLPNAHLVAVTDIVPGKAEAFAGEHGVAWEADLDALLTRPDIDAVSVCVPSGLHAEIGIRAALAGKHLVVEKPIDITVAAADRLLDAAASAGVLLTVISQHRFDPGVRRLRELVDQGRLGRLILGDAIVKWYRSQDYYDSGGWRGTWAVDGGGALMNQGVHYVDLLCWIMGTVDEVMALCATQAHTIEVEDVALALLRFRSGAVGLLQASTATYPGLPERLEISGTGGSVIVEAGDIRLTELADEKGDVGAYGSKLRPSSPLAATAATDPAAVASDAHRAQFADFLTALDSGGQPSVTGEEARASVAVIRAVYDSASSGRPVAPANRRG